MRRTALIVGGALLVVLSVVGIYVRDYSMLADLFPAGDWLRFIANVIVWGSLLGGASLLAAGWVKNRETQLGE